MEETLARLAYDNLLKIFNRIDQGLLYAYFIGDPEKRIDKIDVIEFLLDKQLIETDKDPNLYFLTSEAYELIEDDSLEWFLGIETSKSEEADNIIYVFDSNRSTLIKVLLVIVIVMCGSSLFTGKKANQSGIPEDVLKSIDFQQLEDDLERIDDSMRKVIESSKVQ